MTPSSTVGRQRIGILCGLLLGNEGRSSSKQRTNRASNSSDLLSGAYQKSAPSRCSPVARYVLIYSTAGATGKDSLAGHHASRTRFAEIHAGVGDLGVLKCLGRFE